MAGIYGALGLQDNDRSFVNTIGQAVTYEVAQAYLAMHGAELDKAYSVFVQGTTPIFKERYKLPGGGRLQRLGNRSRAGASRATGAWDVAYPLESFGSAFEWDRVAIAYLTVMQFNNELETIRIQDINMTRFEVLRALLNNTSRNFVDPIENVGTITIKPLANNDTDTYPPLLGQETEAVEDHYLVAGYTSASISDTNNPFPTIRAELEEHFGTPTGYGNICAFINTAQVDKVEALADFREVTDIVVRPGNDTDTVSGLPNVPGRVIGRCNGVWVVEWRWIPADYLLAIDLDNPAPLKQRVDIPEANLPSALTLVATDMTYPLTNRNYERRFGVGVANRLNGVVMQFKASGSYDIPAAYT